jgi:hypothetical protein
MKKRMKTFYSRAYIPESKAHKRDIFHASQNKGVTKETKELMVLEMEKNMSVFYFVSFSGPTYTGGGQTK